MTLSSFLSPGYGFDKPPINERGDHAHYHTSWKGGGSKGGQISQSAISALTLLAFLFFLNILQTCLKDQIQGQSPLVIMMTTQTTTTTTETQRHKRSLGDKGNENEMKQKGDTQEEKISEKMDLRNKERNQMSIKKQAYFKMKTFKKSEKNQSKNLFTSLGVPGHFYSPWLQSVICCKILSCQKSLKEETVYYSSYFRRLINYLCYSTTAAKQNTCTKCFKLPQDY